MSAGVAVPALAAPCLFKHDILQCQDKRASKWPPSWDMSIYRGMLQARHSLPTGAICLKSSCLRDVPVPLHHRVTQRSSLLFIVCDWMSHVWLGWNLGFCWWHQITMLCSSILCPCLPPSRGLPFAARPSLLPQGHRGTRRRPGIPCSLKCCIKVRNPSQPRDTGLRLLTPHSWLSLRSRQQDSIQKSPWALPVPLTSPVAWGKSLLSLGFLLPLPPSLPLPEQCVPKARSISKQVYLAWSDRALISLGAWAAAAQKKELIPTSVPHKVIWQ